MQVPLQARQELRKNMSRWLSCWGQRSQRREGGAEVDGCTLLDLCTHYQVRYSGGTANLGESWNAARVASRGDPSFGDLVSARWLSFDGCRWVLLHPPVGLSRYIAYPNERTKDFLQGLTQAMLVSRGLNASTEATFLAAEVQSGRLPSENLGECKDKDWVAARLWERLCPAEDADVRSVDAAFAAWCAWCQLLWVSAAWDINWSQLQRRHCRGAARRVLASQTLWGTWGDDSERYVEALTGTYGIPPERLGIISRKPPGTLVAKLDWLRDPLVEHINIERLSAASTSFAFDLLLSELERTDLSSDVAASASDLLGFVADHPMALKVLMFRIRAAPRLLADMLMQPQTACLAVRLVMEWRATGGVWDRALNELREEQTKAFAVQDSLSVLVHHLNAKRADFEELASLVTWCYAEGLGSTKGGTAESKRQTGRILLVAVGDLPNEVQVPFLRHLVAQAAMDLHVRFALFGAVVDALACFSHASSTEAAPIVALYSEFARANQLDRTDVASMSPAMAARLVATALAQADRARDAFLIPLDVASKLRAAPSEERPLVQASMAHMLRLHVRMVARAVAGWADEQIPAAVAEALQKLVLRTSTEHAEKGRVGALTDRYQATRLFMNEHGSPAEDIANAWRRLNSEQQRAMLDTLQEADDPVLLAELCVHLPEAAKTSMRIRLRRLIPDDAATPWTWTELQHRISAVLDAGEYALARLYLEEGGRDSERAPMSFRLAHFGLGLRLLMKEQAWPALDAAEVPTTFQGQLKGQAQEQLQFYRATSQLLRPDGQLEAARVAL